MKRRPEAILFDLDDTLISFAGVILKAWETCCAAFLQAHALPVALPELLRQLGETRKWYWGDPARHKAGRENIRQARREVVAKALRALGIQDDTLAIELADQYSDYHHSLVHLYPQTVPVLKALRRSGYRLGLITNGSSKGQREKLSRFGLAQYFEIILIDQEVGFGKPDPRIYEHAGKLLGIGYEGLWMVGDNLVWDIQPPKSLGIYAVWHDYKHTGLPPDAPAVPDAVIRYIGELLSLLP